MADSTAKPQLFDSGMHPRAHTVSLGETMQYPLVRFNQEFGSIPVEIGCTIVDMNKGKGGICTEIGFVKGMEGERCTIESSGRRGNKRKHFGLIDNCRVVPNPGYFAKHLQDKYWVKVVKQYNVSTGSVFLDIAACYKITDQAKAAKAKAAKEKAAKAKAAKEKAKAAESSSDSGSDSAARTRLAAKEKAKAAESSSDSDSDSAAKTRLAAKGKAVKEKAKAAESDYDSGSSESRSDSGSDSDSQETDIWLVEPRVVIRDKSLVRRFVDYYKDRLPDISHSPDIDPKSVQLWMRPNPKTLQRMRKTVKHPHRRYAATHALLFGMAGQDTNRAIDFAIECNYWCVTFRDEDGDIVDLVDSCIVCVWLHYMAKNLVGSLLYVTYLHSTYLVPFSTSLICTLRISSALYVNLPSIPKTERKPHAGCELVTTSTPIHACQPQRVRQSLPQSGLRILVRIQVL